MGLSARLPGSGAAGFLQGDLPKKEGETADKMEVIVFLQSNLKSDITSLLPYSIY